MTKTINGKTYRAWNDNEVPDTAEYIAEYRYNTSHPLDADPYFIGVRNVIADNTYADSIIDTDSGEYIHVGDLLSFYLYRTDTSKDVWHVCGVEVSND